MSETSASKGVLHLTISKIFFILSGYCIIYALTRILGPEGFGIYSTISAFIVVLNTIILFGSIQSVSKFVSEDKNNAETIKNKALKAELITGIIISSSYYLCAPLIAVFLKDNTLTPLIEVSSVILLCYSVYGVYSGYINGKKEFSKQASIEIIFSVLKALLIISAAYISYKYFYSGINNIIYPFNMCVYSSLTGFSIAILICIIILFIITRSKTKENKEFSIKKLLYFQGYIIIFTLLITLLLQTDLILVKKFTDDYLTGIYSAALQLCRVPYQIITGVIFVIFPLISEVTFKNEREKTKTYINNTLRYTLIIVGLIVILFASSSEGTVLLLYTKKYIESAGILSIYMFNILFFCLLLIISTIISASGRPLLSCGVIFITLLISITLNYYGIPIYGIKGAAIFTTMATFTGLILSIIVLINKFKCFIKIKSLLKIVLALILIYLISILIPATSSLYVIAKFIILSIMYFRILCMLKEITIEDINRIKNIKN
ncbi:MAG: lipopolysaccharide biosynthesis protein [Vampirovibrionia bacterium]